MPKMGLPPSQDIQKIIYQLLSRISLVENLIKNKTNISQLQQRELQHWRKKLSAIRSKYNLNI